MIGDAYLPYRTLDDYISGAIIAFTDSTGLKTLEAELQATTRFTERIVEILRESDGGTWQPPALRQRLGEALRHPAAPFETAGSRLVFRGRAGAICSSTAAASPARGPNGLPAPTPGA